MADIEIISAEVCPFAQRSRMVLIEKGVDFSLTEVDLDNKPDWFSQVSPYGKVPVVRHGDNVIWESSIINEYLDECYPEPALMPAAPTARAAARIWIDYCNGKWLPTMYKLLTAQEPEEQDRLRAEVLGQFQFIESAALARFDSRPYWLGETVSLVDVSYYPFFERLPVWREYRDLEIPDTCTRLRRWLDAMFIRESAKATSNRADYYIPRYARYANNSANGTTVQDLRAGRSM